MATLRAVVKLDGVEKARSDLASLGATGTQTTATLADFARAGANANQIVQLTGVSTNQARDAVARYGGQVAQATGEIRGLALAQQEMGAAGMTAAGGIDASGLALGRLRMSLTSTVTQMAGVPPVLGRITSSLAVMGAGMETVVLGLGVIAAGAVIWKAWHEEANKAATEQAKLTKELVTWYETQKESGFEKMQKEIDATTKSVAALRKELAGINAESVTSGLGAVGHGGSGPMAWIRILTAGSPTAMIAQLGVEMAKGTADIVKEINEGGAAVVAAQEDVAAKIQAAYDKQYRERLAFWNSPAGLLLIANERFAVSGIPSIGDQRAILSQGSQFPNIGPSLGGLAATAPISAPLVSINADAAKASLAVSKLADAMETDLLGAIEKLATHGIKSWGSFLGEIESMSLRYVAEIQKQMDALDVFAFREAAQLENYRKIAQGVNIGVTAIGGGIQAFDVGRGAGSSGGAALGGAASGAGTGAAIGSLIAPGVGTAVGAAVGAIDGAILGLFGQAQKLKELRKQFLQDEQKYVDSLTVYASSYAQSFAGIEKAFQDLQDAARAAHSSVSADAAAAKDAAELTVRNSFVMDLGHQLNALSGPAGAFANALDDINQKYLQNIQTIRQLGLGEGALDEAERIRTESVKQLILAEANLKGINDALLSRLNSITGGSTLGGGIDFSGLDRAIAEATDPMLRASLMQERQLDMQFNAYLDGLQQAKDAAARQATFDDAMKTLAQASLDAQQQSLQTLQSQADATQKVVDTLSQFRDSLKLNTSLTTLSPRGQLDEANRQYHALLAKAMAGDATAASALPASAQSYLGIAKGYYGSTKGYVNAFNDVNAGVGAVQDQFGQSLDVQQLMLAQLQKANATLNAQLDTQKQSAVFQAYQAALAAAKNAPGITDENGFTHSAVNDVIARYQGMYPGIQSGDTTPLAQSLLDTWRNTPFDNLPSNVQGMVLSQHLRWNVGRDNDGNFLYQQFASGGRFRGGARIVGERGPEWEITGPSNIATAEQMSAPVVKAIERQSDRFEKRFQAIEGAITKAARDRRLTSAASRDN